MLPNESFFVLKTHLYPVAFAALYNSTRSQTSDAIEFISSFLKLNHKSDSLQLIASEMFQDRFWLHVVVQLL